MTVAASLPVLIQPPSFGSRMGREPKWSCELKLHGVDRNCSEGGLLVFLD